jgi:hypothetical protein
MTRIAATLAVAVALAVALSGCSGGGKKKQDDTFVLPEEITQQDITRLENLASIYPTAFHFPDQNPLPPVLDIFFNGTLAPGTASDSAEFPNGDGPVDYNAAIIPFDLAEHVPVGQPVEVRVVLKWSGDPGASADLDIWSDMPGVPATEEAKRFDESMNWNIVYKQRVMNAVHLDGAPFQVGLKVTNGHIVHPDGVDYSLRVDLHFVANVLAPGAAYAITVPENSTILVVDTERVIGDEHVDLEMLLIGPKDQLVRHLLHNDIGQETLSLTVPGGGEYIVYAQSMHGGFLRLEAQVPHPDFMARPIETAWQDIVLHAGPEPAPGTYAEQGSGSPAATGSNSFGAEESFDVGPGFPLDIVPFMQASAGPVDVAINITSPRGWYATGYSCSNLPVPQALNNQPVRSAPYCSTFGDERGRIGTPLLQRYDRSMIDVGTYNAGLVANGPGATLGVSVLTYTR